jgi:hypothetical protein
MGAQIARRRVKSVDRQVNHQRSNLVTSPVYRGVSSELYMDVLRKVNRLAAATYWFPYGFHVKQQIEQEHRQHD